MTTVELRNELGLTRAKFAKLVGIPNNTIREWEQGNANMKPWLMPMLEMYARAQYEKYKKGEIKLKGGE